MRAERATGKRDLDQRLQRLKAQVVSWPHTNSEVHIGSQYFSLV